MAAAQSATTKPTESSSLWPEISSTQKPWARWWWPGSAVDAANLTRLIDEFSKHGFGGVEVTPIYGVNGAEDRQIDFLSPKWMEMLQTAGEQAKQHGMQLDMATGTGWPFGGPWIKTEDADASLQRGPNNTLVSKPTGMKVKRAAPGDQGLVANPFSAHAAEAYLRPFDEPFSKFPRDLVRMQFHDSFEYSGNWWSGVPDAFLKNRGYDLKDHVAELFGEGDPDAVSRVKSDYRQTLNELHLGYINTWVKWSHDHGFKVRNQAHGAPGNLLDLYAGVDVPETETFGSTQFPIPGFRRDRNDVGNDAPQPLMARFASSAAHVTGKPLASSETFTWLREHFRASLSMMKPEVDQIFTVGINHVLYHGSCYSPADAVWPGWQFYASVEFSPMNTIWHDLPALNQYVARCQSVLQSGKPDNDVLVYWPIFDLWSQPDRMEIRLTMHVTDALMKSEFSKLVLDLIARGYSVDFISDAQLAETKVDGGEVISPGGGKYKALLVPKCKLVPAETAKKLDELSRGAKVIFAGVPNDAPGWKDHETRQKEVATAMEGKKAVDDVPVALDAAGAKREAIADHQINFIRRSCDGGYCYFIANLYGKRLDDWITLGVPAESVAILDPLSGDAGVAKTRAEGKNVAAYLQLEPGQSLILKTSTGKSDLPAWKYLQSGGEPVKLAGTWDVKFIDGGPNLPAPAKMDQLKSWTETSDGAQKFGGTATYRLEFDAPSADAADWMLDLGDVRESARVRVNGQEAGTIWSLPYRLAVGRYLKPGKNVLELDVTNLAANRIRDLDQRGVKWKIMKEINFVDIHYKPFDASKWAVTPSGVLGPVTLTPMKATP